jgi:hypothetical protein
MTRPALLALLAAVALSMSACGGGHGKSNGGTDNARRRLTDLHDISQLRAAFNAASDQPRLVVLVSPT